MNKTQKTCSVCGKKLQKNNKTGFCYKHYEHSRKDRKTYSKREKMTETKKLEEIALKIIDQIILLSEDWRITQKACELSKLIREKMITEYGDRPKEK